MNDSLTVLVVDDDDVDRRAARRALRDGDPSVRITEARSCAEALACLEGDTPPDAVLLDYQLPDGDGLSLIRRVHAEALATPIIMLTGHGDEMVAVELMKAGAADYLAKGSLTADNLWRSLRGVLRLQQAEAEAAAARRANQEAQRQNEERLRTLYDTTSSPDLSFEQRLDRLLEEGCRQFGTEVGLVARVEGERFEVVRSYPTLTAPPLGFACDVGDTFCHEALRFPDAFSIQSVSLSEWKTHPAAAVFPTESYLGSIIWIKQRKWGTLAFTSPKPHPDAFTAGDKEYARLMAQWIGGELGRRQAEEALRASEARFRLLMENVLDYAIFLTDPQGRVADWNAGAERILGYKAGEILGRDASLIYTPEDRARGVPQQEMATALQEGRADDERWHLRQDGRRFFASGVMTPLRDEAGNLQGYSKILRDVTERKQVEDVLRASEERYRSLVSATSQIVWTTSSSGEFEVEQPQWGEFTGQTFDQCRGWGWLTAIHPDDQWQTAAAWSKAVAERSTYKIEHRLRRLDGLYRTMAVRAVPVREADGLIREWVGVHTDVTEQKLARTRLSFLAEASTALARSLDYEVTLAEVAHLVVPALADWCLVDLRESDGRLRRVAMAHADSALRERAGDWAARFPVDLSAPNGAPEVVRTGRSEMVSDIPDALLAANARDAEQLQLLRDWAPKSFLCVPLIARGRTLGAITLISAETGRRYEAADLELAEELAGRAALAVDNARLYNETRARAERESLVNEIGRTLRGSLDADTILWDATAAVGRALGVSRCTWVRLSPARDFFEVAAQQYAAPGVSPYTAVFPLRAYPPDLLAEWQAGQAVAFSDTDADPRAAFVRHLMVPRHDARAFIAAPVILRGEWAGLFVVQQTDQPRDWTPDQVLLMRSIADMLALALENARQYTREHRVADMLQAAFLPDIPDHLLGLDLAKAYSPGLQEAQVGGDLYDAFPLSDGRVALVIADVSGKGLGAAVQTATVKYSLRAFAAEAAAPGLVLRRLNKTLRNEVSNLGEHFVTLFYGVFDPPTGRLTYASAGHESQLIKRVTGGVTLLPSNGPILGITDHIYEQKVEFLSPGDSLILFTDGLTEARAGGTRELLELDRITEAVAGLNPGCGAGAIVAYLEQLALDWTSDRPQDDLALLVARRVVDSLVTESADRVTFDFREDTPVFAEAEAPGEVLFSFPFPASPDYAAEVRQAVAHWMGVLGFDRGAVEDFQTAVTEAITNAVRHGSPGGSADQFHVSGFRRGDNSFVAEVSDSGPGLPTSGAHPPMPDPDALGGRGLPLMHVLADELEFLPAEAGLRVRLVKLPLTVSGK